ncbi:ATP-binding protein [Hydrogenophaga sp.]|uniref:ATP-binding protein n=1 Tax=Hydrogenophaga sp. TaxID=1904254 RepID=UPI002617443F|nr:ATP-binding protein [Hydrogenophaga sp.]MCW5654870.1 HAMP domain-containing protein [Hydrogenophaga sp.]
MRRFRFDTLFLRLFVLMWVVLVLSHVVAYLAAAPVRPGDSGLASRLDPTRMPAMPSLPPGLLPGNGPGARPGTAGPPPGANGARPAGAPRSPGMPARALWLDYGLRALFIALGAWLGARWLAAPMRRLSQAATALARGLDRRTPLPTLDEGRGTVEVRAAAQAFNGMARQLQAQFDQRGLHMAALSHDLRTPLTRLRLRLERLPGEAALAAQADIREMDELIDASLAVMREQASAAAPSVLDLGALLQSLADDLREQGHAVEYAETLPSMRARAHPVALRRVLGNLLDNACRHGRGGVVRLSAVPARIEGQVIVHVDDEGPGIPPEQLERVLQPWVSLPGGQALAGSGLGLAIARDLAEREGGRLSLANRPGGGLRASLTLPAA